MHTFGIGGIFQAKQLNGNLVTGHPRPTIQ